MAKKNQVKIKGDINAPMIVGDNGIINDYSGGNNDEKENKNGRSNVSCSRPPSYDIEAAMLESMRTVPKVKKKAR